MKNNESAAKFSLSHEELRRLSANVDNLYADGTVPLGDKYDKVKGVIVAKDGGEALGVTTATGSLKETVNVYLAKSAFVSHEQLYMTMHHEYMHAFFYAHNLRLSVGHQHNIINQLHND